MSCSNVKKPVDAASQEGTSKEAIANSLESVVTSMVGVADEAVAESYAQIFLRSKSESIALNLSRFFNGSAFAAPTACTRAAAAECLGATFEQNAVYGACSIGKTDFTLTGNVRLSWSRVGCLLQLENDHVTRTMDFTRTGPAGGLLQVTSANHTAWDNTKAGDGQLLIKNTADFSIKILGVHKIFTTSLNKKLFDHSIKTSEDIHLSTLPRVTLKDTEITATRTITSGIVDVYHNILKYKASYKVSSSLGFAKDCCYPVSGQMTATLTGSLKGSTTVDFQATCGSAVVGYAGVSTAITLALCE